MNFTVLFVLTVIFINKIIIVHAAPSTFLLKPTLHIGNERIKNYTRVFTTSYADVLLCLYWMASSSLVIVYRFANGLCQVLQIESSPASLGDTTWTSSVQLNSSNNIQVWVKLVNNIEIWKLAANQVTSQINVIGKPTKMDSTYAANSASTLMVNGITNDNPSMGTQDSPPGVDRWFMLDMLAEYAVVSVRIYRRTGTDNLILQRNSRLTAAVSTDPNIYNAPVYNLSHFQFCYYFHGPPAANNNVIDFPCPQPVPTGRIVTLFKSPVNMLWVDTLNMCEIQIFGY